MMTEVNHIPRACLNYAYLIFGKSAFRETLCIRGKGTSYSEFFCQYGSNLITNLKTTKANLSLKDVSLANTALMSHMVSSVRKLSN